MQRNSRDAAAVGSRSGRARAAAPDLLFEGQQRARLREIRHLLDAPERLTADVPLHRITVFLTYRCNLRCSFCKTVPGGRGVRAADFTTDGFARLLDSHAGTPVRHVHLTGGEAALLRGAPEVVRLSIARGVEAVSATSSGTLAPAVYTRLLEAGLSEIRVSLSASDAALALEVNGQAGAWDRTMRTVRALAALRGRGAAFHLVLNVLVSSRNRERLTEVVRHALGLGPDDVKLIAAVQERGRLGEFDRAASVMRQIDGLVAALPPGSFPLLRRKLRTVFARDAVGLKSLVRDDASEWRCYVPLTERTVDSESYYPCSVYVREGGAPLGRISEPQERQRQATVDFVRNGRCLEDPICREYCLYCTREFNVLANRARRDGKRWRAGRRV